MKKILVIDREFNTVNALTMFCAALGIETVVVHNWPSRAKSLNPKELLMVFANVEMRSVHIDKLFESFQQGEKESVPIVFLYSRTYDPRFVEAKAFPYFGHIKKPLPLNEVFTYLSKVINITEIADKNTDYYARLQEFKKMDKEITEWLRTLKIILNKQAPDAH